MGSWPKRIVDSRIIALRRKTGRSAARAGGAERPGLIIRRLRRVKPLFKRNQLGQLRGGGSRAALFVRRHRHRCLRAQVRVQIGAETKPLRSAERSVSRVSHMMLLRNVRLAEGNGRRYTETICCPVAASGVTAQP